MRLFLIILLFFEISPNSSASLRKKKPISVPFEIVGSYMVLKIQINNSSPLNLILDSGINATIITEMSSEDSISLYYSENTILKGLGSGEDLHALISTGNSLQIAGITLKDQTIHVLESDIFGLSKHTGTKINGLLGSEMFQDYVVEINYDRKRIYFYANNTFAPSKSYSSMPLSIKGQKMFINLSITQTDNSKREANMLIDTGAELAAWFRGYGDRAVKIPDKNIRGLIGQGLSGEIIGNIGRIPEIKMGNSTIKLPIVAFPDSAAIAEVVAESDREGTLGSQILSRFNFAIDVQNNLFYLKPNTNFRKKFTYNIAGIEIVQLTSYIRIPEVQYVWKGSPAENAGVQKGDQILEINGQKCFDFTINEIKNIFETSRPFSLKLLLQRGREKLLVEINMKSVI